MTGGIILVLCALAMLGLFIFMAWRAGKENAEGKQAKDDKETMNKYEEINAQPNKPHPFGRMRHK